MTPIQHQAHEFSRLAVELFRAPPEEQPALHEALSETVAEMFASQPETTTDILALAWLARGVAQAALPFSGGYMQPDAAAGLYEGLDALVRGLERISGQSVSVFEVVPGPADKIQ